MQIHESAEDYLETILLLHLRNGQVRSIDIVNEMGYSKPSISVAMKRLRENGYIDMDEEGFITLNPSGKAIAERIYRFDEVTAVYLMSGAYDLMLEVQAATMRTLASFVSQKLATIDGVMSTATHFVLKKYKFEGDKRCNFNLQTQWN